MLQGGRPGLRSDLHRVISPTKWLRWVPHASLFAYVLVDGFAKAEVQVAQRPILLGTRFSCEKI